MATKDLVGLKFGRWTVLGLSTESSTRTHKFDCVCSCGTQKTIAKSSLVKGSSKSCGCLMLENAGKQVKTHGMVGTPEYYVWANMLARCRNPNSQYWANYGGRGIKVCPEWLSFGTFFADMGLRPEGTSLDREDNDKDYCKNNCRWATPVEQACNTTRNVFLTYEGMTKSVSQWARAKGIPASTIGYRLKAGATVDVALSKVSMRGTSLSKFNQPTGE